VAPSPSRCQPAAGGPSPASPTPEGRGRHLQALLARSPLPECPHPLHLRERLRHPGSASTLRSGLEPLRPPRSSSSRPASPTRSGHRCQVSGPREGTPAGRAPMGASKRAPAMSGEPRTTTAGMAPAPNAPTPAAPAPRPGKRGRPGGCREGRTRIALTRLGTVRCHSPVTPSPPAVTGAPARRAPVATAPPALGSAATPPPAPPPRPAPSTRAWPAPARAGPGSEVNAGVVRCSPRSFPRRCRPSAEDLPPRLSPPLPGRPPNRQPQRVPRLENRFDVSRQ